jgi:dolichyl-diphosphooligosaccharide--protein glycosyltransferase
MRPVERGSRRFLLPLALFGLAFLVRCLPYQTVSLAHGIAFVDPDAYYHMRRIVYSMANFPSSLGFDPYINFPHGGQPIWTPLFDWCLAALLLPFRRGESVAHLERLVVFVPPLLGAATVVALYSVARRHFGAATATLAGALLAILSAHFWYSQLGFLDHHAAEALAATAMLGAAMSLLARASAAPMDGRARWRSVLATGTALGMALLLWPGMLLHVGLVDAALVVFALTRPEQLAAASFVRSLALLHLIALALVAPLGLTAHWREWGPFSPVVLSAFQPWLMAAACLWSAGCAAAWRSDAAGGSRARRTLSGLGLGVALLLASLQAFPGLVAAASDPWEWFAGADPFQRNVGESLPLFFDAGQPSLRIALMRLSVFSLLVPVALGVGAMRAWRAPRPAPLLLFYWWSFGLAAAAVVQRRFFNAASVGVALLFALTLVASYRALVRRAPRARLAAAVALTVTALLFLLPTLPTYYGDARNWWRTLRGADPQLPLHIYERGVVMDMANWIRRHTPVPSDWLDASARPSYGILAPWTIGHVLEYRARRPTVTDNFGNDIGRANYDQALRYFQSEEPEAAGILADLDVRYVVTQRDLSFLGVRLPRNSIGATLFRRDGAALERHRLIFDSRPQLFHRGPPEPIFKVFEFVPGARIVGESRPGVRITARLAVRTNRQRRFVYNASVLAADDGRYALRVPYATTGGRRLVRVDPAYRLECGGEQRTVRVDEADVQAGALVQGPRLCAGP